ncbi:MAG TPA: T9SS type A sorting domain-containing protein, partial [Adhaeribacter sp.]|nr:T9SS type A sorting domain-containing protein [Adhaeribacter sp.]
RVNVIAVDGANRKWVGTENGAWLFNETGDQVIYNFTMQNSPLPSGRITDIAVNHATGDVFFSTEGGLASFRAGATVTTEKLDCANVFPNPVRPGYSGDIAITGISNNASVKITDITGALVFQTKALGGTALWNGRDNNGKRVRTGVYLVLSSNAEGAETCISKVAVIE